MLIHLDCSPEELSSIDPGIRDDVVSVLMRAHRRGDHVVIVPRQATQFLLAHADLSQREKAILSRVGFENTQTGGLVRAASRYVRLHVGAGVAPANAINVSFADFRDSRLHERSILLVENIRRDGLLYSELMRSHFDLAGAPYPAFEPMHGGGADLTTVYVEQIKQKRIVCGVIDTDRNSPHGSMPKLAKLRRIAIQMGWPVAFGEAPPCREAENCLPTDLMVQLASGRTNVHNCHYRSVAIVECRTGCNAHDAFWLFADLKKGVSAATIAMIANPADRIWLTDKLQPVDPAVISAGIQGYGDAVFDQLVADNRHLAALRSMTRTRAWREVFGEFIAELLWIFAGGRRLAA